MVINDLKYIIIYEEGLHIHTQEARQLNLNAGWYLQLFSEGLVERKFCTTSVINPAIERARRPFTTP